MDIAFEYPFWSKIIWLLVCRVVSSFERQEMVAAMKQSDLRAKASSAETKSELLSKVPADLLASVNAIMKQSEESSMILLTASSLRQPYVASYGTSWQNFVVRDVR
jgi:hypothetical protein